MALSREGGTGVEGAAGSEGGRALRALCVGDCCLDRYLPPIDATFVGGQSVNVAVGLARAGLRVSWAGVVGTDSAGRWVLDALAAHGVESPLARTEAGPTGVTIIGVEADGDRNIIDEQYGVSAPVTAGADVLAAAATVDLVFAAHVTNLDALAAAIGEGGALGVDLSEDPIPDAAWVGGARFLFLSRPRSMGDALLVEARGVIARGAREVVVTRGAVGAVIVTSDAVVPMVAIAAEVVDTLGAGDAHAAAYMSGRLAGRSVIEALGTAALAAAHACRHPGAWVPAPALAGTGSTPGP